MTFDNIVVLKLWLKIIQVNYELFILNGITLRKSRETENQFQGSRVNDIQDLIVSNFLYYCNLIYFLSR